MIASAQTFHAPDVAPPIPRKQPGRSKTAEFKQRFATAPPVIPLVRDKIVHAWLNGTLTLSLSKQYGVQREVLEWMIQQYVAPLVRQARRVPAAVALSLAGLIGGHAVTQPMAQEIAWRAPRSSRGRARRRGLDDGYQPEEVRTEAARRVLFGAAGAAA